MEDAMTVSEFIEYLKTLKQDYKVVVGDSEYPNTDVSKESITEFSDTKTYMIY